jgi:hypothetical protein
MHAENTLIIEDSSLSRKTICEFPTQTRLSSGDALAMDLLNHLYSPNAACSSQNVSGLNQMQVVADDR